MSWPAKAALGVVALLVAGAVLAPLVAADPANGDLAQRFAPIASSGHPLGTDGQGRDLLSRLVWGARPSLLAGVVPVALAVLGGAAAGIAAPLAHPVVDGAVMRVLDVLYAFPGVLLALTIASALGPGLTSTIVALAVALTPAVARVVRTEVVRVRRSDWLEAARAAGAPWHAIAVRQVLPVVAPALLAYATSLVGLAIVYAAGLGYLGLGVAPPTAEWGSMLDQLRQTLYIHPGAALLPAAAIFAASVAFNVLGDGLRDRVEGAEAGR